MATNPPTPAQPQQETSFIVMPREHQQYTPPAPAAKPAESVAHPTEHDLPGNSASFFRSWKFYTIVAVVAAVILAGAGYYLFGVGENETPDPNFQNTSRLPTVWIQQFFEKQTCDDSAVCGEEADPDADGLSNYDEFKQGTAPTNADTDEDGLADGDEVNIYFTNPTLKYTDRREIVAQNDWRDGSQIKNGYDPLTPGLAFTDLRRQQIEEDIAEHGQHEPTLTTLGTAPAQEETPEEPQETTP